LVFAFLILLDNPLAEGPLGSGVTVPDWDPIKIAATIGEYEGVLSADDKRFSLVWRDVYVKQGLVDVPWQVFPLYG
jgi:hypothetical protein